MRPQCHLALGKYLVRQYLPHFPKHLSTLFLLGCVQPDKNPTTYFKGSLRSQLLRGHNWDNARIYMQKLCTRLEKQPLATPAGAYMLGKLMHYLADAFTYVHNAPFCTLPDHRAYEARLEAAFLPFMDSPAACPLPDAVCVYDAITAAHREYLPIAGNVRTDAVYAFSVACRVMELLTASVSAAV